jgi:hypothetical protein
LEFSLFFGRVGRMAGFEELEVLWGEEFVEGRRGWEC